MSTSTQIAAGIANAQSSTGPHTGEGCAVSSRNALKTGLYAATDFIRPGEESLYAELSDVLDRELSPSGILERNLVDEIRSAMWRLRRCGLVEGTFAAQIAASATPELDPMQNEATAKTQAAVDRARSQANRLLHKCTTELRRLQTERQYRNAALPEGFEVGHLGICDLRVAVRAAEHAEAGARKRASDKVNDMLRDVENQERLRAAESRLTKRTQFPPTPVTPITRDPPAARPFTEDAA